MQNSKFLTIIIILLVGCISNVASDIYAPSLPAIAKEFGTPVNYVQWTMAIYLFGISMSQVFYGPISEGVGRRLPLMFGLATAMIGTLVCIFSQSIIPLLIGRFLQGIGTGAGALWRPIFRDVFQGDDLARYSSYLVIVVTFVVPAAPYLGGHLQEWFGWQSTFQFILIYLFITLLIAVFTFKDTSKHHHLTRLKPQFMAKSFSQVLTSPIFMGYCFGTFLTYGSFFSWFTVGPILLIDKIENKIDPSEFGMISFFGGGAAMILASLFNTFFLKRNGSILMLRIGWSVMALSGSLMMTMFFIFGLNLYAIVIPVILFYFGSSLIFPNIFARAFQPFGHIAGYAGSSYTCIQNAGGAVLAGLMSYLPDENQFALGVLYIIAPLLSWTVFEKIIRPREQTLAR